MRLSIAARPDACTRGWTEWTRADRPDLDRRRPREVVAACAPLPAEPVAVGIALDRVLAADVRAAADVPRFDNSAMDGFAVRSRTRPAARCGSSASRARGAGRPLTVGARRGGPHLDRRPAARRRRGGRSRVEQVHEADGRVTLDGRGRAGPARAPRGRGPARRRRRAARRDAAGRRRAGRRRRRGRRRGLRARAGRASRCSCTGDELRPPGAALGPGEIHNSNAVMLAALAAHAQARRSSSRARSRDEPRGDRGGVRGGARDGRRRRSPPAASRSGPHDHVKPALGALGVRAALLARRPAAGQADVVRDARRAARLRPAGQPRLQLRHVRAVRAPGAARAAGRRAAAAARQALLTARRAAPRARRRRCACGWTRATARCGRRRTDAQGSHVGVLAGRAPTRSRSCRPASGVLAAGAPVERRAPSDRGRILPVLLPLLALTALLAAMAAAMRLPQRRPGRPRHASSSSTTTPRSEPTARCARRRPPS